MREWTFSDPCKILTNSGETHIPWWRAFPKLTKSETRIHTIWGSTCNWRNCVGESLIRATPRLLFVLETLRRRIEMVKPITKIPYTQLFGELLASWAWIAGSNFVSRFSRLDVTFCGGQSEELVPFARQNSSGRWSFSHD